MNGTREAFLDTPPVTKTTQSQFGLASLFWITTAAAMMLAYARSFGESELRLAVSYAVFVAIIAPVVGSLTRAWNDAIFWSLLVTLLALIAVAGYPMPNRFVVYGWGLVGAGCGAVCGARWPTRIGLGAAVSAVLGVCLMTACVLIEKLQVPGLLVQFDIISAGVVGGFLRPLVELIERLRVQTRVPRIVVAAWLSCCLVAGKALVP